MASKAIRSRNRNRNRNSNRPLPIRVVKSKTPPGKNVLDRDGVDGSHAAMDITCAVCGVLSAGQSQVVDDFVEEEMLGRDIVPTIRKAVTLC